MGLTGVTPKAEAECAVSRLTSPTPTRGGKHRNAATCLRLKGAVTRSVHRRCDFFPPMATPCTVTAGDRQPASVCHNHFALSRTRLLPSTRPLTPSHLRPGTPRRPWADGASPKPNSVPRRSPTPPALRTRKKRGPPSPDPHDEPEPDQPQPGRLGGVPVRALGASSRHCVIPKCDSRGLRSGSTSMARAGPRRTTWLPSSKPTRARGAISSHNTSPSQPSEMALAPYDVRDDHQPAVPGTQRNQGCSTHDAHLAVPAETETVMSTRLMRWP